MKWVTKSSHEKPLRMCFVGTPCDAFHTSPPFDLSNSSTLSSKEKPHQLLMATSLRPWPNLQKSPISKLKYLKNKYQFLKISLSLVLNPSNFHQFSITLFPSYCSTSRYASLWLECDGSCPFVCSGRSKVSHLTSFICLICAVFSWSSCATLLSLAPSSSSCATLLSLRGRGEREENWNRARYDQCGKASYTCFCQYCCHLLCLIHLEIHYRCIRASAFDRG